MTASNTDSLKCVKKQLRFRYATNTWTVIEIINNYIYRYYEGRTIIKHTKNLNIRTLIDNITTITFMIIWLSWMNINNELATEDVCVSRWVLVLIACWTGMSRALMASEAIVKTLKNDRNTHNPAGILLPYLLFPVCPTVNTSIGSDPLRRASSVSGFSFLRNSKRVNESVSGKQTVSGPPELRLRRCFFLRPALPLRLVWRVSWSRRSNVPSGGKSIGAEPLLW